MPACDHGGDPPENLSHPQAGRISLSAWNIGKSCLWDQCSHPFSKDRAAKEYLSGNRCPWRRPANPIGYELAIGHLGSSMGGLEQRQDLSSRQPRRSWTLAHRRPVTTPGSLWRSRNEAGSHRIEYRIATEFQQIAFLLHHEALEPPLQDMADAVMAPIEAVRVTAV